MEQTIRKHKDELVEIVYMSKDGTFTKRKVKVQSTDDQYVYGYCYLRKQMRTFSKENILASFPQPHYH